MPRCWTWTCHTGALDRTVGPSACCLDESHLEARSSCQTRDLRLTTNQATKGTVVVCAASHADAFVDGSQGSKRLRTSYQLQESRRATCSKLCIRRKDHSTYVREALTEPCGMAGGFSTNESTKQPPPINCALAEGSRPRGAPTQLRSLPASKVRIRRRLTLFQHTCVFHPSTNLRLLPRSGPSNWTASASSHAPVGFASCVAMSACHSASAPSLTPAHRVSKVLTAGVPLTAPTNSMLTAS